MNTIRDVLELRFLELVSPNSGLPSNVRAQLTLAYWAIGNAIAKEHNLSRALAANILSPDTVLGERAQQKFRRFKSLLAQTRTCSQTAHPPKGVSRSFID